MLSKLFCHPYRHIRQLQDRASLTLPHVISIHKRVDKEGRRIESIRRIFRG